MKNKQLILVLTVFWVASAFVDADAKQEKETLRIYLPREVMVEDRSPRLGEVAIIRGSEALISKAGDIALGSFSTPDQSLVINKNTVLSRLACNGISARRVTLTGAEETVITRQHQLITGRQFLEQATAFVEKNPPNASICRFDAFRTPDDLLLPGASDSIKLVCRFIENGTRNQCKVLVTVVQDGKEVGREEVVFRFRYQCRKVITKTAISKGDLVTTENVTIENGISNYPEPAGWTAPYGLVVTRSLAAGAVIAPNMVRSPEPQVLLKRNQSVSIKIENGGLVATAVGKALQDGVAGEYIKVQNIDSKIIIMAKVNEDGTVEPVF